MPEDLVESLCLLLDQLAVDAPTGAVDFEEEAVTPQRYAEMVSTTAAMGRPLRDGRPHADRQVVAQSTLAMSVEQSTKVYQLGTFVHREHRAPRPQARPGHEGGQPPRRPGRARRPDPGHPQNAETNDNMVSSNEQMGFRPIEIAAEFVKRL